jgi:hypothetical protein
MSELLDAFRREMPRFEELRKKIEEWRKGMSRVEAAEREVGEVLAKASPVDSLVSIICESVLGTDHPLPQHLSPALVHLISELRDNPLGVMRAVRRRAAELRRMTEVLGDLEVPEPPPPSFSCPLDLEAEIPLEEGLRQVRLKEVRLDGLNISVTYELGGKKLERAIEGFLDLPLLVQAGEQLSGLLGEATRRYQAYLSELERLKDRILREHPREILMGDL